MIIIIEEGKLFQNIFGANISHISLGLLSSRHGMLGVWGTSLFVTWRQMTNFSIDIDNGIYTNSLWGILDHV